MKGRKHHRFPWPIRLILWLVTLSLLAYAGMIAYVWIGEGSVMAEVPNAEEYDAIIVLGAQVKADGSLSVQLTWRLDAAKKAYDNKKVPVVVCGAQGKDEPTTEAEAMKNYLIEQGVAAEDILTDPESFNTSQNLKNAHKLL